MMSRHGVKPDSLRKHEAQIRSGLSDGHVVEQWEPSLKLIEQANYMKFFRPRWGFFFGQILGRIPWLCYKFSSLLDEVLPFTLGILLRADIGAHPLALLQIQFIARI